MQCRQTNILSATSCIDTLLISDDCWLEGTGKVDEAKLLASADGRKDDVNKKLILDFLTQQKEAGVTIVQGSAIVDNFTANDIMTRTTVFNNINKLLDENLIVRFGKGAYGLAA